MALNRSYAVLVPIRPNTSSWLGKAQTLLYLPQAGTGRGAAPRYYYLPRSREQVVVSLVSTDPEPMKCAVLAVRHNTIRAADIGSPDFALLFESQGRVKRILLEQRELGVGQ